MGNYNFELDLDTENTMSVINGWIEPESRVLEFGPANGRLTKYLSQEKKCDMTIVELDAESGEEASRYAGKSYVGSELGDIEKYHWLNTDEKYDYIIFADVLEHLRDPETVLKKCEQVLSGEGCILLSVPNLGHNSIIISLLKDRFTYTETGLLDRTHIHFFTYRTLVKMIVDGGYYVNQIVPIYSRVGDNEVDATYDQVPVSVERYLRKRETGNIYQFVCRISKKESGNDWAGAIKPFMQEYYRQIEAQCYYITQDQSAFSDDACSRVVLPASDNVQLSFVLPAKTGAIRFDPLEEQSIVTLNKAEIVTKTGENYTLHVKRSTAELSVNDLYFFDSSDPHFIFEDFPQIEEEMEFRVSYQILSFAESEDYYREIIDVLMRNLSERDDLHITSSQDNEDMRKWIAQLEENEKEFREALALREKDLKDANGWIAHLEQDVANLTNGKEEERKAFEEAQGKAKAWIAHLEEDVANLAKSKEEERKAYEEAQEKANAWIAHLEKDIAELIQSKENERLNYEKALQEARDWIVHLECAIAELKKEEEGI